MTHARANPRPRVTRAKKTDVLSPIDIAIVLALIVLVGIWLWN